MDKSEKTEEIPEAIIEKDVKTSYLEELEKRLFHSEKPVTKSKLRERPKIKGETVLLKEVKPEPIPPKIEKKSLLNNWWFRISISILLSTLLIELFLRRYYDTR